MPGFELIGPEEQAAVDEVFQQGGVLFRHGWDGQRRGRYRVLEFERAFAEHLGARHALAVTSGTAALKVALVALGVRPGDEVITQAFTFVATVEAILDVGAVPVVVNVDDTLNMAPDEFERAITPRTRAVVPVHMLGVAARIDRIRAIARAHGLSVLEDNCESLGATWDGRPLGAGSEATAYSFDFGKVITTGEGGMVTTDDDHIYALACEYHDHGHENNPAVPRGRDTRRIAGFNYRMGELPAAVGLAQLRKLPELVRRNRENRAALSAGLARMGKFEFRAIPEPCQPLDDAVIVLLPSAKTAQEFARRMAERGLATKNLPDAMDWHFAGTWEHIFGRFGISPDELWTALLPSYERLARCVALPVMVRDTPARIAGVLQHLEDIAKELL
jgi:8-amino-3,8-dideoxy-alpha-D-manno-octulosonate transaminase